MQAFYREVGLHWPDLEQLITAVYTVHVRPGDLVLDVGVNHGTHFLELARLVGPGGRVIGIEAVPAFAAHVRDRLDGDLADREPQTELHRLAVSRTAGEADFYVTAITDGDMNGLRLRPVIAGDDYTRITVPASTIDAVIGDRAPFRFAKLDIEGAEYDALLGGTRLPEQRPLMVFEFDSDAPAQFGFTADDLLALLRRYDYRIFDIFGFEVVDGATMMRAIVWNFVAVPPGLSPRDVLAPAQARLAAIAPGMRTMLPTL